MSGLIRWHWKAIDHDQRSNSAMTYEFNLDHFYTPANPELFPYAEGHTLILRWRDPFYPVELGRVEQREKFITEEFRATVAVVEAAGVAGTPFWAEYITDELSVRVALAKPDNRFGDNMGEDRVFRVSYEVAGQRWFMAPVDPAVGGMSKAAATALLTP
jgi:hypothetical protein